MFLKEESLDLGNTFFKHLPTPSFMTDNKGKIVWCSQEAVKQLGYSINDLQDMDVPFFTDYTQGHITANWETILQTEDPFEISPVVLYSKDRIAIKTSIVAKSFSWQDTRYVLFQIKTDTKDLMEASSFHELQLIKKGLSNSYMIVYIDPEGLIMHANDKFLKKSAWTPKRIVGKSFWQLLPDTPEHMAIGNQIITRLRDGKVFQGSVEKITKDGTTFWVNLLAIPVHNTQNNTPYFLLLEDEITEKKLMQTKLEQIAYVDTETGLLSRHRLEEVVNEYINEKKSFSFVFIGIDQFYTLKEIFNDQTETKMLNEFTKRLKIYFEDSIIARSGRDDFAIVTPLSDWYIQGFANYLKQNPIYLDSKIIPITVSGAITRYPEDQQSYLHLLKATTNTIQKVKLEGGSMIATLSKSDHSKLSRKVQIEKRLLEALNHRDLHVMFLPQQDVKTGAITSVEALVRWEDSVLGTVSPEELIPIAEETGLINEIGQFMLEKSCEQAAIWAQKGMPIKVSFNSSIREFRDKNMVKTIRKVLEKYKCSPELIQIEFTEKFALEAEAEKAIVQQIQKLQQDGIVFVLDDFGTGYASLRYLQMLPIGKLKIDKSFINSVTKQEKLEKLVQGLVQFGQSLDLQVVAEGVESAEQFALLKRVGCDAVQGYYISPPISAEEVEKML
ncbi:diguanylate cyclase/phosphodiesterase with PAS/PAC sensor(s) [Psychrobacillus psychrotolerans]|uniref:Diguanylate cyclase/phosphodiesterase with PAS/PAC sensor(S) n=1 Tax=Psychrobacillus psychrotolerans TaxID=126156 RepID=A0A1I5XKE5_9BACI|nr:EAL domain-containing protein [Psychrobacillus psychrotolerans]SFQ32463.1 diguanylate cyclase/phosphodiesterase with PAS/PAC sensor(s) [Psychrobacillus psychrotolerans]